MQIVSKEGLSHYLYYPEDYKAKPYAIFPILLFLYGGGESGESLTKVKKNGPQKLLAQGKQFPFLVLAPQNLHKKQWWNTRAIIQLLDAIVANNMVDKNRIYLTGLSRGGGAAWEMTVEYPDKFAALTVVCGMAPVPYASWVNKEMPIWVFHGEEDKSTPISESMDMVAKLKKMGYDVKFAKYKGVGHNAWDKAYATPELCDWLMKQRKNE